MIAPSAARGGGDRGLLLGFAAVSVVVRYSLAVNCDGGAFGNLVDEDISVGIALRGLTAVEGAAGDGHDSGYQIVHAVGGYRRRGRR